MGAEQIGFELTKRFAIAGHREPAAPALDDLDFGGVPVRRRVAGVAVAKGVGLNPAAGMLGDGQCFGGRGADQEQSIVRNQLDELAKRCPHFLH